MKKSFFLLIALLCTSSSFAQKNDGFGKFDLELGFDVPFLSQKIDNYKNSVVPFLYAEGRWQLEEQPIDLGFHLGMSVVKRTEESSDDYNNFRTIPIMAVGDYQFGRGKKFNPYLGLGLGASQNCIVSDFGTPNSWNFVAAPRLGVRCFKTLNLGLTYYATKEYYSRLNFNLGFYF